MEPGARLEEEREERLEKVVSVAREEAGRYPELYRAARLLGVDLGVEALWPALAAGLCQGDEV